MTGLDDVDFNELVVVARSGGEIRSYKAWKRGVVAFNDPKMWRDIEHYDTYFERIDDAAWAMAGYGVIVMDMDAKTAWSFNDYAAPWSFNLPQPNNYKTNPHEKSSTLALLADPSVWNDVALQAYKRNLLGKLEDRRLTLADVLRPDMAPEEALRTLEARGGELRVGPETILVTGGRMVPAGWTVGCEIGQDGPEGLLRAMETWQAGGFPAPAEWDGFDNFMTSAEIPFEDEEFEAYLDEAEDECDEVRDDMIQAHDLARRYRLIKARWEQGAPGARMKGASPG